MIPAAAIGDASLRHVRKLRLSVSSAQAERRALRVLEESLRLISLPGEATGKIFYFRRLQLPPLLPDEHPVSYAGELEQKCRMMAQGAVHFSDPTASNADVAFAWSPIEPWQELARRLTRAQPLHGWFWRSALPQSVPISALQFPLNVLLQVAARHGAQGVLEFLAGIEPDVLHAIFAQLEVAHVAQGKLPAFAAPVDLSNSARTGQAAKKLLDRLPSLWRQLAREYVANWKDEKNVPDLRAQWLVSAAWLIVEPERALDHRLPEQVACMVETLAEESQPRAGRWISGQQQGTAMAQQRSDPSTSSPRDLAAESLEKTSASSSAHSASPAEDITVRPLEREQDAIPGHSADPANQAADTKPERKDDSSEILPKQLPETRLATSYAGFFYCLGLLDRMGIRQTLSANPQLLEMNFVRGLLRALASAAGVPEDDPVGSQELWLHGQEPVAADTKLPYCSSLLPSGWREKQPHVPEWALERLTRIWVLALRRRVWRAARMSWAKMARRLGEINATRTYLEITMPQSSLEVRARKAGFDVDPGWLPWLNKVVIFHYACQTLEVVPVGGIRRGSPTAAMLSRMRQTNPPGATARDAG
jgi:hypothetical protein